MDKNSIDDVGFEYPPERLARVYAPRPKRKPLEPGALRTLFVAATVGIGIGVGAYYLKPDPRSASASPVIVPTVPKKSQKVELFQLPEWNESAHQRDQK